LRSIAIPKETAIALLNEPAHALSKLATVAAAKEPQVYKSLKKESSVDLRYMAQAFGSSLHVPVKHDGKTGSVNFWSSEADGFPSEAVSC